MLQQSVRTLLKVFARADSGLTTNALQIESIVITPDPLRAGDTAKVTIKATVQEEIKEGAYVDAVVRLGLIKLVSKQFDPHKNQRLSPLVPCFVPESRRNSVIAPTCRSAAQRLLIRFFPRLP